MPAREAPGMGILLQFPPRQRDDAAALLDQIRRLVEGREAGQPVETELERLRARLAAVVRGSGPDAA